MYTIFVCGCIYGVMGVGGVDGYQSEKGGNAIIKKSSSELFNP